MSKTAALLFVLPLVACVAPTAEGVDGLAVDPTSDVDREAQALGGDGLRGEYFDDAAFTRPAFSRVDPKIAFDWGKGSPDPRIGVDEFSIRWTGFVVPEYSQTYTFYTAADDGVRLWVDGKLVIDDWNRHAVQEHQGTISLKAGQTYAIKLEYFDAISSASVSLSWSSASRTKQIVPTGRLFSREPAPLDAHEALLSEVEGFATGVTGGKGGATYWVTNLHDSGPGSLRDAATRTEPLWIRFKVSGTIALDTPVLVRANKTIDGRGQDVTITRNGLYLVGSATKNVIVTNLKFTKTSDDLLRVYDHASKIWIHHDTFSYGGDGAVDVTEGSTDVTVSWCHFFGHDKTMLVGASPTSTGDTVIRVTVHHNFFDGTVQRHPRLRFGKVHAYNNYLRHYANQGMYSGMKGQLLSENNVFEAAEVNDLAIWTSGTDPEPGYARSKGDFFNVTQRVLINEPSRVFDPRTYYTNAVVEPADMKLAAKIAANAGARE